MRNVRPIPSEILKEVVSVQKLPAQDNINNPATPLIIMVDILSLIKSGATGLTLNLSIEDLLTFAKGLIEDTKAQLLPLMVSAAQETLLSKKEVMAKFDVCDTTLWNWQRKKYLIPVKIGRKVHYRQNDIERLVIERGK
ncbi:DNA-binding protein [Sanguibacteroides justesenii]|nr:DNA-binding protein [Sanguibacteroides justesenii]